MGRSLTMRAVMGKVILVSLGALALSACTTVSVRAPGTHQDAGSKWAPVNLDEGKVMPGRASYLNEGASFVTKSRRNDTLKGMYKACNGKYRIIEEYSSEGDMAAYSMNSGSSLISSTTFHASRYVNFLFECVN